MTTAITLTSPSAQQTMESLAYGPAAPADLSDGFEAGLSPDALMAYCQSRLDSIDGQVQTSFDSQQKNANEISQIDSVLADLKTYSSNGTTSPEVCTSLENSLAAVITQMKSSDPGCPALPGLTQTYNNMVWSGTGGTNGPQFIDRDKYPPQPVGNVSGDNDFSNDEIQSFTQSLSDAAANLNSGSELEMVNLQSLMSQRETAISLTTNLVESLGDQENKIADNIGH
jgi:hypothetical protein